MLCYKKIKVALLFVFLMGCEFQPLYGTRGNSIITGEMKFIEVSPISDRIGQTLRNHLIQNFKPLDNLKNSKYVLNIQLSENKQNLAIKKSEIATRANLIIIANYQIISKSSGELLSQGSSQMITSYNILTHTFATLIAEKDARKRAVREISADIINKIIIFFRLNKNKTKDLK